MFTLAASAGVGAGTRVADRIEAQTMQRAFSGLLIVIALYTGGRAVNGLW